MAKVRKRVYARMFPPPGSVWRGSGVAILVYETLHQSRCSEYGHAYVADSRRGEVQKIWGSAFVCAPLEQEECECGEICRAKRSLPRCPQINCELLQNEEFSLKYQAAEAVLVQEAAVLGLSYASSYLVRSAVQYALPHLHHYTKRKKVYNFNGLLP